MQRRNLLIGMGSIAAGGAATIGTGAFSSVEANRSVSMNVADDSNALLQITESDGPNNAYVDANGDSISFQLNSNSGATGSGVNDDAYTIIRNAWEIRNQGTQTVQIWAESVPDDKIAFGFDQTYYSGAGTVRGESGYDNESHDINISRDKLMAQSSDPRSNWGFDDRILLPEGGAMFKGYILIREANETELSDINKDITIVAQSEEEITNY